MSVTWIDRRTDGRVETYLSRDTNNALPVIVTLLNWLIFASAIRAFVKTISRNTTRPFSGYRYPCNVRWLALSTFLHLRVFYFFLPDSLFYIYINYSNFRISVDGEGFWSLLFCSVTFHQTTDTIRQIGFMNVQADRVKEKLL